MEKEQMDQKWELILCWEVNSGGLVQEGRKVWNWGGK